MNPILVLTRNNLHLTRKAIETFKAQDIEGGAAILVVENGSTDGTKEWLRSQVGIAVMHSNPPLSVAESWNRGLKLLFGAGKAEYCLVVNNDVELRPDTYRHLVADGGGFVTAVGTRDPGKIKPPYEVPDAMMKRPHPDFSCYLIRKETYERVGPFDEGFKIAFYEDNCYHLRMHRAGIRAEALELPFLHHGSMTIKNADIHEVTKIQNQAALNKEYFKSKYGVYAGTPEYYALFGHSSPEDQNEPAHDTDDTTKTD